MLKLCWIIALLRMRTNHGLLDLVTIDHDVNLDCIYMHIRWMMWFYVRATPRYCGILLISY